MARPYPRLWELLESSMPSPERFQELVDAKSAEELVALYADVVDASAEVRPKWEGPYIDESIGHLSEDGCEDLTDWIVGQGYELWSRARGADDGFLGELLVASDREPETEGRPWLPKTPPIGPTFFVSYDRRFGETEGDFFDRVQAALDARSYDDATEP